MGQQDGIVPVDSGGGRGPSAAIAKTAQRGCSWDSTGKGNAGVPPEAQCLSGSSCMLRALVFFQWQKLNLMLENPSDNGRYVLEHCYSSLS